MFHAEECCYQHSSCLGTPLGNNPDCLLASANRQADITGISPPPLRAGYLKEYHYRLIPVFAPTRHGWAVPRLSRSNP